MDNEMMTSECRAKRLEHILELQDKGLSRAQIAERVGLTRDQVQGIIYKYKKRQERQERQNITRQVKAETTGVQNPSRARVAPSLPLAVKDLPIISSDLSFDPPDGKLNIYNVKRSHCRFLDNEGFFCGEPIARGSYCQHHYNLCYTPTTRKVRPWRNSLPSLSENFV